MHILASRHVPLVYFPISRIFVCTCTKKRAVEQAFVVATFARLQGTLRFAPDRAFIRRFFGIGLEFVAAYFLILLRIIKGRD